MDESQVVPIEEARQGVRNMSRRLGLLHICFARTLIDELGEEKGRELIERAIWTYGTRVGEQIRARVHALGLEPTLENFSHGSDLPAIGFEGQSVVVDGEPRHQAFGCALAEVWAEYGEQELGGLYCLVDPAKMQAYNPDWTMVHTKKIPRGDECCEIAVRRRET